jgi:hypothetical protein
MQDLRVEIEGGKRNFSPGDFIAGVASWTADKVPNSAELRLFWYTQGKGTQDVGVVNTMTLNTPGLQDRRDFRLPLPQEPYSCSGKLVSIVWAIELILEPGRRAARTEFVMGPSGAEVVLGETIVK